MNTDRPHEQSSPIDDGRQNQTTLWLDPAFGASGDMMLGALASLGSRLDTTIEQLCTLDIAGWSITSEVVRRASLTANRVTVTAEDQTNHRSWSTIDALLAGSALSSSVTVNSRATFRLLAEVEAAIHGVPVDAVEFHEVGAVDAIVDIVGSWLLLEQLAVDEVIVSSVGLGHGTIEAAHGTLSLPAPATTAILRDAPVHAVNIEGETITPTGAALLATMATRWDTMPAGTLLRSGRGAGLRDPKTYPNVLNASLLEARTRHIMLATNLDDVTAETVGHLIDRLLEAGADDAWVAPIGMKKNRPGYELKVLATDALQAQLQHLIFSETQSLGLRSWVVNKRVLERHFETVIVRGEPVRIKVGPYGIKPEHDDLVNLSAETGLTLQQLSDEARRAHDLSDESMNESSTLRRQKPLT